MRSINSWEIKVTSGRKNWKEINEGIFLYNHFSCDFKKTQDLRGYITFKGIGKKCQNLN